MPECFDVIDLTTPRPTSPATSDLETQGGPPSLRRRAPARIDILLKSGECPSMSSRMVHVSAGRSFVLEVVPQTPNVKVEITAEPPLLAIVPASRIEGGPTPTYQAEFSCHLRRRIIPLPTTAKVHVTALDGLPTPCRVAIPFRIWPTYSSYLLWWSLVFLGIVGLRWERTAAREESIRGMLSDLWADLPHLLGLFAFGFLVVIPLRLIGSLISLADSSEND
jgi:hypothetical protein